MTDLPLFGTIPGHKTAAAHWQQSFTGALLLFDGADRSQQLENYMRTDATPKAIMRLMESIRANSLWYEMEEAHLVGRAFPQPMLAVFGQFTPFELSRWRDLATLINEGVGCHRYIGYAEAEAAAQKLADNLLARYGRDALSRFQFTAVPRGGVIVLGILSYLLDLRPDQIVVSSGFRVHGEVLVVVDDCSLSGLRFQQFIGQIIAERVVFCLLCAVPDLCRMIERREPKVEACFNAIDLCDIGAERFGDAYPQWCAEQRLLMRENGYWVGIPQPVSFAWSEPQTLCWNAERKSFDSSWNLMPPHLCLKRRVLSEELERCLYREDGRRSITMNDDGEGSFRAARRVLWIETGSAVSIARIPEASQAAPCFRLQGVAANMWKSLMDHGTLDGVCEELLQCYDVDPAVFRRDLAGLVSELTSHYLLTCETST